MPVTTFCPQCQQRYRLKDAQAGKNFRCVKCQSLFIPTAEPEPPPAPAAMDETVAGTLFAPPPVSETVQGKLDKKDEPQS